MGDWIADTLLGASSLRDKLQGPMREQDRVLVFGKPGTTTRAYGHAKKDKPLGEPRHTDGTVSAPEIRY